MDEEAKSTKPKPFVFVLMPFDSSFDDIYKFGIKGAAQDAGAYAERIDEQIFTEGILDRVFNQINKADVIVADMTGRNANVFYEVGYAHALGKIVLLLTQDVSDIPFDLQHHQHTVYRGKIETLRTELTSKLEWAILESKRIQTTSPRAPYEVSAGDLFLPQGFSGDIAPTVLTILADNAAKDLSLIIRNSSAETTSSASYLYLFADKNSVFKVHARSRPLPDGLYSLQFVNAHPLDASDGLSKQYRLPAEIPLLPPGALEPLTILFSVESESQPSSGVEAFRLRIHTTDIVCDYRFKLEFQPNSPVA